MKATTALLLAACLTPAIAASAAGADDVKALYEKHCASCHAKDGSGNTKMGKKTGVKDYRDAKFVATIEDAKALETVKAGIKEKGQERMKPFKDVLTDDEIKSLIAHMKAFAK